VGLALLAVGAELFVGGAVALARAMGVSDLVIGLTIVSAGTSLPEVATSLVATLRGQRDIAIGNVVGSNVYNLLAVLGVSALVTPGGLRVAGSLLAFDLPVMVAVAVACLPIFLTGYSIARLEAATFLGFYLAYAAYLVLAAQDHDALSGLSAVMLEFVVPLAVLGIAVSLWRHLRGGPAAPR
jgi:cation:H+ antiporter